MVINNEELNRVREEQQMTYTHAYNTEQELSADVIVAGGGTAGTIAAIAAARAGMRTIVVERQNCLGGTTTSGLIIQFGGGGYPYMTGILKEIVDELICNNQATFLEEDDVNIPFDPEALKELLLKKALESGVQVLFYTQISDVLMDGSTIEGLVVNTKSGRYELRAHVVIDATGDGDVAHMAGAPCLTLNNGGILGARVAGIDYEALVAYMREHPDQICENDLDKPLIRFIGFFDLVEEGFRKGYLEPDMMKIPEFLLSIEGTTEGVRRYLRVDGAFPEKGTAMIGYGAAIRWDINDPFSYAQAESDARRKNRALLKFLRKCVPGFKDAYIVHTASNLAIWASRRVTGDYTLTSEDIHTNRHFEDVVVKAHANLDHRTLHIKVMEFDIPFRAMLPAGVENLMVAGRNISTSPEARIPGINIPICMQMGEVAGIAATLALNSGCTVRQLKVDTLQEALREAGVLR
jgi:ribulose 1,5-bisphosphate synthetase/thiazole synthase